MSRASCSAYQAAGRKLGVLESEAKILASSVARSTAAGEIVEGRALADYRWAALIYSSGPACCRQGRQHHMTEAAAAPAYQGGVGVRVTPRRSKRQLREILTGWQKTSLGIR